MYILNARTGHHTRSSSLEEKLPIDLITMGSGLKLIRWFLARNPALVDNCTPFCNHTRWSLSTDRAVIWLTLLADAKDNKKAHLSDKCFNDALCIGSNGGPANFLSTNVRLHAGTNRETGGRVMKDPAIRR